MGKRKGKSSRELPPNLGTNSKPEGKLVRDKEPCSACAGRGFILIPTLGGLAHNDIRCSKCGGTGFISKPWLYREK